MKVTRATLSGGDIKSLIDGESKPINMRDGENPYDFISRIYNELASAKIETDTVNDELLSSLKRVVEVYDSEHWWTTTSKREALANARAAVNKASGE